MGSIQEEGPHPIHIGVLHQAHQLIGFKGQDLRAKLRRNSRVPFNGYRQIDCRAGCGRRSDDNLLIL
jgi:hypothetical protein